MINSAVVFDGTDYLYFGGYNLDLSVPMYDIYRLRGSPKFVWKRVGELNSARHGHSVAIVNNIFMVIGGNGLFPTEGCGNIRGEIKCVKHGTRLNMWKFYPALMPVTKNYCQ